LLFNETVLFCLVVYVDKPSKPVVKIPPAAVKGDSITLECVTSSLGKILIRYKELPVYLAKLINTQRVTYAVFSDVPSISVCSWLGSWNYKH